MRITKTVAWLAAGAALAAFATGTAVAAALPDTGSGLPGSDPVAASTATDSTLAERLAFSREEERMARDLYRLLSRHYDIARPFGMIARSEQRHFAAVGTLLDAYDVPDPSAGLAAGTYADPDLQSLYATLRRQGLASRAGAFQVGIAVEERDIADLEATLDAYDQDDVQLVLGRLADGSRMHLRAFERTTTASTTSGPGGAGWGGPMMGRGQARGQSRGGMMGGPGADHGRYGAGRDGCPMAD